MEPAGDKIGNLDNQAMESGWTGTSRNWKMKGSPRSSQLSSCRQGPQYPPNMVALQVMGRSYKLCSYGTQGRDLHWTSRPGRSPGQYAPVANPSGLHSVFEQAWETVKCCPCGWDGMAVAGSKDPWALMAGVTLLVLLPGPSTTKS